MMNLHLNKLNSKYGKRIGQMFYIQCLKLIIFLFICNCFFLISNATNFFSHSLNRFVFKKTAYAFLIFFNLVHCMQIYPLNSCKLDWEENLFNVYIESIVFRIKILNFKDAFSVLRQFLTTESPLKVMKNAFYFTSKARFVLKIFKTLWSCSKTAW